MQSEGKAIADLTRFIRAGKCVLFAGAGISMPTGLPSWQTLIKELLAALPPAQAEEMRKAMPLPLGSEDFLHLASFCRRHLPPEEYSRILKSKLAHHDRGRIGRLHELLLKLPFRAIITTNFDTVLEDAHSQFKGYNAKTVDGNADTELGLLLFEDEGGFILKAHGSIGNPRAMILTAADYREMIHKRPAFSAFFSALLLNYTVLFVGYSYRDRDFQMLLDQQFMLFGGETPPRYALMADVDPARLDVLRQSNIHVIPYDLAKSDPHRQVVEILEGIQGNIFSEQPLERVRHDFLKLAGINEGSESFNICFTHKGPKGRTHVFGPLEQYKLPGFPFDEAEIITRIWNMAVLGINRGWSSVRPYCSCDAKDDRFRFPTCIIGSPKENKVAKLLMDRLEEMSGTTATLSHNPSSPSRVPLMKLRPDGRCAILWPDGKALVPHATPTPPTRARKNLVDYALVLVVPNILAEPPEQAQRVMLIAGCKVAGQVAVNRWLTDSGGFSRLLSVVSDAQYASSGAYAILEVRYDFKPNSLPLIEDRNIEVMKVSSFSLSAP